MNEVTAVVLAGGLGTRLRECVADVPKPMAPVAGRPFLEYVLQHLRVLGISKVLVSIGYLGHVIEAHFGSTWNGLKLDYVREEEPQGTGGAIRDSIARVDTPYALVLNGDTFVQLQPKDVLRMAQEKRRFVIFAREVPDTSRFGALKVENDKLIGFMEKGRSGSGLINAGIYWLDSGLKDSFGRAGSYSFETDWLAPRLASGSLSADVVTVHGQFIDIGVPEDFRRAQSIFTP